MMDCGIDGLTFQLPSRVKPQFAADCDISTIVRRFLSSGELPNQISKPTITDAVNLPSSFADLMDSTTEIKQQFDQLPLEERNKYNNNAELWFESTLQNENQQTAVADERAQAIEEGKPVAGESEAGNESVSS